MKFRVLLILVLFSATSCTFFKKVFKKKKEEVVLNESSRFGQILKSKDYEFKLKMANHYYEKNFDKNSLIGVYDMKYQQP